MTWTASFGKGSSVLLYAIVRGLALTRISPNVLTFIGLVINVIAAVLFGYAKGDDHWRYFLYAGLVIIGAGIFDMVDGRVYGDDVVAPVAPGAVNDAGKVPRIMRDSNHGDTLKRQKGLDLGCHGLILLSC